VRELVLNLTLWEAHTSNQLAWYVDNSPDCHLYLFAFLMELKLWLICLLLVTSNEKSSDMVRVWHLPWLHRPHLVCHLLEVTDKLLILTSLCESTDEATLEFLGVVLITLKIDTKEDWEPTSWNVLLALGVEVSHLSSAWSFIKSWLFTWKLLILVNLNFLFVHLGWC